MELCDLIKNKDVLTNSEIETRLESVIGKIEFIRYMSINSYKKLEKMVTVKMGTEISVKRDDLIRLAHCN